MTCVVAATDGTKVYMGADSSAVDDSSITSRATPKVFIKGEFIIGYCHSFRLGQIVQFLFNPPAAPANRSSELALMSYMVKTFVPELKKCLEENNFPYHDDDKNDWELLVGFRGKIFSIQDDWQVGLDTVPYAAVGAGAYYALGAMYSLPNSKPADKIRIALEAATELSPFVKEPFHFLSR